MQQGSAYDANAWLLARVRRVRALHGDRAPRRTNGAVEVWRSNWVWLQTSLTVVSLLCIALPLDVGLRVRATMGQRVTLAPPKPPPPLVRDALIRLLSVTPAARLTTVAGTAEVVAWSPDGRLLAAGYSGGALLLWDVARGRLAARVAQAHRRFVGALTWSPDGRLLATAAADGTAVLWRVGAGAGAGAAPTLAPIATIRTAPLRVPAVAFAPRGHDVRGAGGDTLAVSDGLHTVTLWDVTPMGAPSRPMGAAPAPAPAPAYRVVPQRALTVPGRTTALAWAPDGARLAAGTTEGRVVFWRRGAGWRRAARALGSAVWALAWAPSGATLAAGCADGAVRLLSGTDLRPRSTLVAPFHRAPVRQVPDYGAPAAPAPRTGNARVGAARLAAGAAINGLAWSPDGDLLAVTATGVPLRLWRPSSGAVLATYHPAWDQNVVSWRPDGTLAAVAMDDGGVVLLRAAEPAFMLDVACGVGARGWCALLGRPLAPIVPGGGDTAVFMGR